jgi:hypothetical protein
VLVLVLMGRGEDAAGVGGTRGGEAAGGLG